MTSDQYPLRVYSSVPNALADDGLMTIGHAVPHKDGRGYDVLLHALPLNSRLVLRSETSDSEAVEIADAGTESVELASLKQQVDNFERSLIEQCLVECGGRITEVMRRLDIPRRTLNEKMLRLGIDRHRAIVGNSDEINRDSSTKEVARQQKSSANGISQSFGADRSL